MTIRCYPSTNMRLNLCTKRLHVQWAIRHTRARCLSSCLSMCVMYNICNFIHEQNMKKKRITIREFFTSTTKMKTFFLFMKTTRDESNYYVFSRDDCKMCETFHLSMNGVLFVCVCAYVLVYPKHSRQINVCFVVWKYFVCIGVDQLC